MGSILAGALTTGISNRWNFIKTEIRSSLCTQDILEQKKNFSYLARLLFVPPAILDDFASSLNGIFYSFTACRLSSLIFLISFASPSYGSAFLSLKVLLSSLWVARHSNDIETFALRFRVVERGDRDCLMCNVRKGRSDGRREENQYTDFREKINKLRQEMKEREAEDSSLVINEEISRLQTSQPSHFPLLRS